MQTGLLFVSFLTLLRLGKWVKEGRVFLPIACSYFFFFRSKKSSFIWDCCSCKGVKWGRRRIFLHVRPNCIERKKFWLRSCCFLFCWLSNCSKRKGFPVGLNATVTKWWLKRAAVLRGRREIRVCSCMGSQWIFIHLQIIIWLSDGVVVCRCEAILKIGSEFSGLTFVVFSFFKKKKRNM